MKIAIIDDGISADKLNGIRISHYTIKNGEIKKNTKYNKNKITHAFICTYILTEIIYSMREIEIIDVKIFEQNKTSVNDWIYAMEWCAVQNISIINMSFGTLNYFDSKRVKDEMNRIWNKDIIIVAAHNNMNLISYPACCKGVFGVRSDSSNILRCGQYAYQASDYLYPENCFIAHKIDELWDNSIMSSGHSFAAPIITGHIASILYKEPGLSFKGVYEKLVGMANGKKVDVVDISKKISGNMIKIETPVIAISNRDKATWQILKKLFIQDGYFENSFCETNIEENVIPIDTYLEIGEEISKDFIATISYIYDSDLFMLCLKEERFAVDNMWELIDFMIGHKKGKYYIYGENCEVECTDINAIYECLLNLFHEP